jgi:hypothetical protein
MLGSKSNFFLQDRETLAKKRHHLIMVLQDFNVPKINKWTKAFDYFRNNPSRFDGATIVKDLYTINGLDAPAMNHDYAYIHLDFWTIKGLKKKLKADFQYGKDQEKTGKGSITAYTRTVLLWLSTPLFYIYLIFKR